VTEKLRGVPGQLLKVGVTVKFPIMAVVPLLTGAVHGEIDPDPLVPMENSAWFDVQAIDELEGTETKEGIETVVFEQTVILDILPTTATGFT
jgi:translation initiation factor 2 gamma subunit (eIF-2gamma)